MPKSQATQTLRNPHCITYLPKYMSLYKGLSMVNNHRKYFTQPNDAGYLMFTILPHPALQIPIPIPSLSVRSRSCRPRSPSQMLILKILLLVWIIQPSSTSTSKYSHVKSPTSICHFYVQKGLSRTPLVYDQKSEIMSIVCTNELLYCHLPW